MDSLVDGEQRSETVVHSQSVVNSDPADQSEIVYQSGSVLEYQRGNSHENRSSSSADDYASGSDKPMSVKPVWMVLRTTKKAGRGRVNFDSSPITSKITQAARKKATNEAPK